MDFNIMHDVQNGFKNVDAICQFIYNGFQISISTAGRSFGACATPVCVFTGKDFQDVAKDGFRTVQDAIDWIIRQSN